MYLKYETVDIDNYQKNVEIAMFGGITYDYNCGCCRISFLGNFVDILQPMSELEYSEIVYMITSALSNKKLLELNGKWILDFEDHYNDWDTMLEKAKNIIF